MKRILRLSALPVLAIFACAPGLATAAEIIRYDARVTVEADGTGRGTATVFVSGAPAEGVDVPFPPAWTGVKVAEAAEGLKVEPKEKSLRVTLPPEPVTSAVPAAAPPSHRFTFTFDVPEAFAKAEEAATGEKLTMPRDSRTLKFSFVNTQATLVKAFGMLVVLPADMRFHAIREQLPKLKKSEVEPRVRLAGADGRQTALLQSASLKQGDSASMQLEAIPNRRSPFWLVAGIALSSLYLFKFRDLVAKDAGSSSTR
jgi:hypothetical protein